MTFNASRELCYGDAGVSADAKSRVVPTKVKVEHFRQFPPLPPCSYKWLRKYRNRSGLKRLNSKLADGCMPQVTTCAAKAIWN